MPIFEIYVDDDRYSVPSLYLITVQTVERARAMADGMLRDSEHHLGVEVRQGGERLYGGGTLGAPEAAARGSQPRQGA
jgi:hypothetical protein